MMKQLEHRGARGKALEVFHFVQQQSECKLTERNYLTIIGILSRDGKLALSREIFDSMKKAGVPSTVLTYTAVISGYVWICSEAQVKIVPISPPTTRLGTIVGPLDST
jgi:pentatricopeptide repeat protein